MPDDEKPAPVKEKTEETTPAPAQKDKADQTKVPVKPDKVSPASAEETEEDELEIVESEEPEDEEVEIVEEEEEEEEGYKVKPKPDVSPEEKKALAMKAVKRSKKPKFRRQEWFRYVRLGDSWRKPRGIQSKTRRNFRYRAPKVSTGYRGPKTVRGRHPSGFEDVLVYNPADLEALDPKKQAARIGHTVGTRKRIQIKKKADELGIRILNWGS